MDGLCELRKDAESRRKLSRATDSVGAIAVTVKESDQQCGVIEKVKVMSQKAVIC